MSEDTIRVPPEKAYELLKLEALRDVQGELFAWAKRRVWLASAALAVVAFFGINGLVISSIYTLLREDLREAIAVSVEAGIASDKANLAADESAQAVSDAARAMDAVEQNAEKLTVQASELDGRLSADRLEGERKSVLARAQLDIELLQHHIGLLEELVEVIAKRARHPDALDALSAYKARVKNTYLGAEAERAAFTQNSSYFVVIHSANEEPGQQARAALEEAGFVTGPSAMVPPIDRSAPRRIEFAPQDIEGAKRVSAILKNRFEWKTAPSLDPRPRTPSKEIRVFLES